MKQWLKFYTKKLINIKFYFTDKLLLYSSEKIYDYILINNFLKYTLCKKKSCNKITKCISCNNFNLKNHIDIHYIKIKINYFNTKNLKEIKLFCNKTPRISIYRFIIINLSENYDNKISNIINFILKIKINTTKIIVIINNTELFNKNLFFNFYKLFVKLPKKNFSSNLLIKLKKSKFKNFLILFNYNLILTLKYIKNNNYKLYILFINIIINNKIKNLFKEKYINFNINILLIFFQKLIYDILMLYINNKIKYFLNIKRNLKVLIKRINIIKLFSFNKKINNYYKINKFLNKNLILIKIFIEYYNIYNL